MLGIGSVLAWHGNMPDWELQLFTRINGAEAPAWVTTLASLLSDLVWLLVGAMGLALVFWRGKRNDAWNAAVLGGSAYVATYVLEHIVQRARPAELLESTDVVVRAAQDGYGYSSGHVAVLLALVLWAWPHAPSWLRALMVLLVVGEAWSRIFLGVHLPLDTAGGVAMAFAVFAGIKLLPKLLRRKLYLN
jgi:undecaprenyl-diphosphatase